MHRLTIILILFPLLVFSQEENSKRPANKHAIGLNLDATTGAGISYRHNYKNWTGEATTFASFSSFGRRYFINGLSLMYNTNFHNKVSSFIYAGGNFRFEGYKNTSIDPLQEMNYSLRLTTFGLGGGVNLNIIDLFDLTLRAGYAYYSLNSQHNSFNDRVNLGTLSLGVGIYYKF